MRKCKYIQSVWQTGLILNLTLLSSCHQKENLLKEEGLSITRSKAYSPSIIQIAQEVRPDNGKRVFILRKTKEGTDAAMMQQGRLCDGLSVMNSSIETRYNKFHFILASRDKASEDRKLVKSGSFQSYSVFGKYAIACFIFVNKRWRKSWSKIGKYSVLMN